MAVELSHLLQDRPALVTARLDECVTDAMERMLEHAYSQLPVVVPHPSGVGEVALGLITTTAVARAALHLGEPPSSLRVHHALERGVPKARLTDILWDTLDHAREGLALLVEDSDGRLKGLLTGYDFTAYLRVLSEDTLAVADVEATIKQLVLRHFEGDEGGLQEAVMDQVRGLHRSPKKDVHRVVRDCLKLVDVAETKLKASAIDESFDKHFLGKLDPDFDRLNFGQFTDIFLSDACWADYEPAAGLPSKAVRQLLETVRDLRNRLMHNRGVLGASERDRVRYCRDLLGRLADQGRAPAANEVVDVAEAEASADAVETAATVEAEGPEFEIDGVYDPLARMLNRAFPAEKRLVLTFADVDRLVYGGLPSMASLHRSWWNNDDDSPQGAAWASAGWRVAEVNLSLGFVVFARTSHLERAYIRSFKDIFAALKHSGMHRLPVPNGASWCTLVELPRGGSHTAHLLVKFTREARFAVSLWIDSGDRDVNKATFDTLLRRASELEQQVGESLVWERLDQKQSSRVSALWPGAIRIRTGEEDLTNLCAWAARVVPRFLQTFEEHYRTVDASVAELVEGDAE